MNLGLPNIVSHIYHPDRGPFRNLCNLADAPAQALIASIRDAGRPRLTPGYLERRRATERWLVDAAHALLGQRPRSRPVYGFLGSFGHSVDRSRPAVVRLERAALGVLTFTLGDSMTVAARPNRRLLDQTALEAWFAAGGGDEWVFTDAPGFAGDFVEVQIWSRDGLTLPDEASHSGKVVGDCRHAELS